MATIQEAIELVDGASATLRMIAKSAESTSNSISETRVAFEKMQSGMNGARGVMSGVTSSFKSMIGQFAMGNIAANAVMTIGQKLAELPGRITAASDAYAGMQARLKLVAGSAREAAAMNEQIFAAAIRSRGSYEGMLANVSKLAMTAKEGFPDPKEVVPFVEGIQKLFAVGGTGVEEQKNAMLQLTQALGSGRLQGDEFRSIAEAAPLIEQMIAKEMGVSQGALKQLGSEGKITADVIKAAIFNNMADINRQFDQMPVTWASTMQQLGNTATLAMAPAYEAINKLANTEGMKNFVNGLSNALFVAGSAISVLISGISDLGGVVYDGVATVFNSLGGILDYVGIALINGAAGLAAWAAYLAVTNGLAMARNGIEIAHIGIMAAKNTVMGIYNGLMTIMASRTALVTAATWALNVALTMNPIGLVIAAVIVVIGLFLAWLAATKGLREGLAEGLGAIASVTQSVVDFVIKCINKAIDAYNALKGIMNSVVKTDFQMTEHVELTGGDWGKTVENGIKTLSFDDIMPKMPTVGNMNIPMLGGGTNSPEMDDIAGSGRATAGNTERIADSMDLLDEDLQYLRDVAEREAIDKYTTASVTVQMGGVSNTINNDMDVDGVINQLTEGIYNGMVNAAQEVHV